MNCTDSILDFLKKNGTVTVPEWGVFSVDNTKATFCKESNSLLPPTSKINFSVDYQIQGDELATHLANKNDTSTQVAKEHIKIQTDFWKKKLLADSLLAVKGIGIFTISDDQMQFEGEKIPAFIPDYYGLEEIHLGALKRGQHRAGMEEEKEYQFHAPVLWLFLLIIPVLGMVYMAIQHQDLLFGKKSFSEITIKTTTKRIQDTKTSNVPSKSIDTINIPNNSVPSVQKTNTK